MNSVANSDAIRYIPPEWIRKWSLSVDNILNAVNVNAYFRRNDKEFTRYKLTLWALCAYILFRIGMPVLHVHQILIPVTKFHFACCTA